MRGLRQRHWVEGFYDATCDGPGPGIGLCWSEWQDLNLRPPRPERGDREAIP